jgi:hypothetical protein
MYRAGGAYVPDRATLRRIVRCRSAGYSLATVTSLFGGEGDSRQGPRAELSSPPGWGAATRIRSANLIGALSRRR